jgi:hypothetical protein
MALSGKGVYPKLRGSCVMAVPSRLSLQQLKEIYSRLGFQQRMDNPFTFEHEDSRMLFHSPYRGNELYWVHVMDDIEVTENLWESRQGLAEQFIDILFELYDDGMEDDVA